MFSLVVCLERDLCLSYTLHTLTFSMRTNSVLTPCKQGAVHFSPLKWPNSPVLTPCKQGAVHFSPLKWLQARCGTLPCNHLNSYRKSALALGMDSRRNSLGLDKDSGRDAAPSFTKSEEKRGNRDWHLIFILKFVANTSSNDYLW